MTPTELADDVNDIKSVFDDSWVLDQSYLSHGTAILKGVCPCLASADLIIVRQQGSFWICKECLYGS